jgi:hypothetical protein
MPGQAPHRKWAVSEAAVLCLRDHPPAQTDLACMANKHGTGNALTGLDPKWAHADDDRCTRHVVFERAPCCQRSDRGAAAPRAERDTPGMHLQDALDTVAAAAALNAKVRLGRDTLCPAL